MKPLRIALTKGRLERDTVVMFERIGFDCTAVHEKGRKLICLSETINLKWFLQKQPM